MDGIRRFGYMILSRHFWTGIGIGFLLASGYTIFGQTLSSTEVALIQESQDYSLKFTGDYFSDVKDPNLTINTYETVCKGYYIRHETDTEIEYIGYGDLANEYTYTEQKPVVSKTATTTDIISTDIPLSTTTEPLSISI